MSLAFSLSVSDFCVVFEPFPGPLVWKVGRAHFFSCTPFLSPEIFHGPADEHGLFLFIFAWGYPVLRCLGTRAFFHLVRAFFPYPPFYLKASFL